MTRRCVAGIVGAGLLVITPSTEATNAGTLATTASAPAASSAQTASDVREIGPLVLDGVPEIPPRIVEKLNQYQNVRSAALQGWAPQGGVLIATRFADTFQLHHVQNAGGDRRQLTFFHEPVMWGAFGKSPEWFVFRRDVGGDEMDHIYRFDLAEGEAVQLTQGRGQNDDVVWSNAKDRIAWRSTVRNQKDHDIWVMDPLRPESAAIVAENSGYWTPLDWSPDDSKLLLSRYVSSTESYVWLLDLASKEKTAVGNHGKVDGEAIMVTKAMFDAQGTGIYEASDEGSEFHTLRHRRLGEKKATPLTDDIPWDVKDLALTPDRKTMAFAVNADGVSKLYLGAAGGRERKEIPIPFGTASSLKFSDDGRTLAIGINTPTSPADVWTVDVATGAMTRWTESEVGGLDPKSFLPCEIVRFPTFDTEKGGARRTIPAFVYKPQGKGPFPVIVNIHGGPESQSSAIFSATAQYYSNELGCAVIYPNVRGSSGFGKTYLKLDNAEKREDSVKDIGALLDWIATQPDLDAERVGVIGGSYGGYMSLACLVHYSDRLRAGIDVVGISNFVTFLTNTSEYRRDVRRVEYGDERDAKMRAHLEKISPANSAEKIDVPLFVIQGANDPRVPASEAEQIVRAVRANGNPAWFMLAKDEGHGFDKKSNKDQMEYAVTLFWETYLLGNGTEPKGTD